MSFSSYLFIENVLRKTQEMAFSEPLKFENFPWEACPHTSLVCSTFGGLTFLSVRTPSKPHATPLDICLQPMSRISSSVKKFENSNLFTRVPSLLILLCTRSLSKRTSWEPARQDLVQQNTWKINNLPPPLIKDGKMVRFSIRVASTLIRREGMGEVAFRFFLSKINSII